jgi:hypothetical protein
MAGRIFERKRRQMPCTLTLDGRNHGGLILDVSPGGLFVQTSAKAKPGDQLELQTTLPGVEGRVRMQVEVVRKVVVPTHLLKVARGGIGVRIINAPEAYYAFMDALGVTADAGTSKIEQLENRRAQSAAASQATEAEREPKPAAEAEPPASQPQFRVRIKQSQGPRSRTVGVEADSEEDAQRQALHAAGAGWIVLGVERVDAD